MTTEILLSFIYFTFFTIIKISFTLNACLVFRLQFYKHLKQNLVFTVSPTTMPRAVKYKSGRVGKFLLEDVTMNEVVWSLDKSPLKAVQAATNTQLTIALFRMRQKE